MKKIQTKTKPSFVTKNKDILVVGGVIVVLAGTAVAYYLVKKKKEKKTAQSNASGTTIATSNSGTSATFSTPPFRPITTSPSSTKPITNGATIKIGSRGNDVKVLQRYLKIYKEDLGRTGPKRDGVDGIFGPKTARAAQKRLKKTVFNKMDIAGMLKALKSLGK